MKKASSMSKGGNNLSKSHFRVAIFAVASNTYFFFIAYGQFMVREKVEEVLFLIWNISKTICNSRSQIT